MTFLCSPDFKTCIDFETRIGEGPVWDDRRAKLWFVDILAPAVFAYDPDSRDVARFPMPDLVTSIGLTLDDRLLLSLRKALYFFDPATKTLEFLCNPEPDRPMNRLNDGKVGPDGCFWIGSMFAERPTEPTGALYRVTPAGEVRKMVDSLHVSNGLAWSPDGRMMYHADSRGTYIKYYPFDPATGGLGPERELARPDLDDGLPDGAAVDRDGNYWSAGVTAGCLNVFSPEGRRLAKLPAGQNWPTMPCFGGRDGRTLFVTGLSRGADRGTLVAVRTAIPGVPVARFGERPGHPG